MLFFLIVYLTIGTWLAHSRIYDISLEASGGDIWYKIAVAMKWAATWPVWAFGR